MNHPLLAQKLLERLLPLYTEENELYNALLRMFTNKNLLSEMFQQKHVHLALRYLLVKRDKVENDSGFKETEFSKLVMKMKTKYGFEKAVDILVKGHEHLAEPNRPFIAQALARLYKSNKDLERALTYAQDAVDNCNPANKFAFVDTLGQIYKAKML